MTEFFDNCQGHQFWFWEYIVENGISECDVLGDITQKRVLRVPQWQKDAYIVEVNGVTRHFWHTVG